MSKPYYETEEYSEAENELDTYDDKVKLVMEYIVSEKHKDQQIAELQKQLEEKEQIIESCNHTIYMNMLNQEMLQLKVANLEQSQNQKAIAELEKAEKVIEKYVNNIDDMNDCLYAIDQQIKQLKEVK